mmetsp:Transcript_9065/g.22249  ORF Transcript_9065/g.22249 Transcript_9065/m.22249 type:complete len:161 (+) Transcript_9065:3-485(+)
MGLFTLSAAGAVKDTFEKNKEKIDAIPIDEEVKAADDIAQKENDAYSKATVWSNVPLWAKIALILSVASMIACCGMLVAFNTHCFAEYDLMYTISEHLGGKWYNLVKPLGRYAMMLIVVSYLFLKVFQGWASGETSTILKNSSPSDETKPLYDSENPRYT